MSKVIKRHFRGTPIVELQSIRATPMLRNTLPSPGTKAWELSPAREVTIHHPEACAGEACVFHRPSGHGLREYPLFWYAPVHQSLVRQCRHGQWHWDPDSLAYFERATVGEYPRAREFHVLPWSSAQGIMGKDNPRCLVGACCSCCGPKTQMAHIKWLGDVRNARAAAFKRWTDDELARERQERFESEQKMRQAASYTWKVMNNSTTWSSVNGVWNGNP
jgi:hypothetical protein